MDLYCGVSETKKARACKNTMTAHQSLYILILNKGINYTVGSPLLLEVTILAQMGCSTGWMCYSTSNKFQEYP